jgi:hypothetical protein
MMRSGPKDSTISLSGVRLTAEDIYGEIKDLQGDIDTSPDYFKGTLWRRPSMEWNVLPDRCAQFNEFYA